jgi:hypothetical protein
MNLETAPGWVALPRPGRGTPSPSAPHYVPQLILPRGPRAAVAAALYAYHPCTKKARLAWKAARRFGGLGGFHLVPRRGAPPAEVTERLAPYLPPRSTIAVAESDHPGRLVALIIGELGNCHGLAKIATDAQGRHALENEARALGSLAKLLPSPVSAPRLLARDTGLVLLEAVRWIPRRSPAELPDEVARAMGAFFTHGDGEQLGRTHGDFAPWNLLETEEGWVLVDWEEARERDRPLFDLFHYLFMAHQNLAAYSREEFLDGLDGKGPVGRAIAAYTEGADLRDVDLRELLVFYLRSSGERLNLESPDGRSDYRARQRLLSVLGA